MVVNFKYKGRNHPARLKLADLARESIPKNHLFGYASREFTLLRFPRRNPVPSALFSGGIFASYKNDVRVRMDNDFNYEADIIRLINTQHEK